MTEGKTFVRTVENRLEDPRDLVVRRPEVFKDGENVYVSDFLTRDGYATGLKHLVQLSVGTFLGSDEGARIQGKLAGRELGLQLLEGSIRIRCRKVGDADYQEFLMGSDEYDTFSGWKEAFYLPENYEYEILPAGGGRALFFMGEMVLYPGEDDYSHLKDLGKTEEDLAPALVKADANPERGEYEIKRAVADAGTGFKRTIQASFIVGGGMGTNVPTKKVVGGITYHQRWMRSGNSDAEGPHRHPIWDEAYLFVQNLFGGKRMIDVIAENGGRLPEAAALVTQSIYNKDRSINESFKVGSLDIAVMGVRARGDETGIYHPVDSCQMELVYAWLMGGWRTVLAPENEGSAFREPISANTALD
jgi:hypothetical protein